MCGARGVAKLGCEDVTHEVEDGVKLGCEVVKCRSEGVKVWRVKGTSWESSHGEEGGGRSGDLWSASSRHTGVGVRQSRWGREGGRRGSTHAREGGCGWKSEHARSHSGVQAGKMDIGMASTHHKAYMYIPINVATGDAAMPELSRCPAEAYVMGPPKFLCTRLNLLTGS